MDQTDRFGCLIIMRREKKAGDQKCNQSLQCLNFTIRKNDKKGFHSTKRAFKKVVVIKHSLESI